MIQVRELSNKRVNRGARRLSAMCGENKYFGAMDIVHVATAQELAESEGMQVMP